MPEETELKEAPVLTPEDQKGPVFIYSGDYQNPLIFLRINSCLDRVRLRSFMDGAKGSFKLVAIAKDLEFRSKKYKVLTYDDFVKQWKEGGTK